MTDPSAGVLSTGAAGAVTSTTNVFWFDASDSVPKRVCVAETVWLPGASAPVGVKVHVPSASTVATAGVRVPSTVRLTVAPGMPVPR